jgi:GT2 family glycosyltransferase
MSKSISVVIPNYNGIELFKVNLPPLYKALEKSGSNYEIIVADDASNDDSVDFLKQNYPDVKILTSPVNKGFSSTMNRGIFAAKNDLVLSLNSDVVLMEDYFLPLFRYFKDPDTFAVAGKIIGLNDDQVQDSAKYPNVAFGNISGTTNYKIVNYKSKDTILGMPSFFTSGANTVYDREKLVFAEGFTELYSPYYGEDLDLSMKAWRLGWKSYYEEKAICRHPSSSTIKKYNPPKKIRVVTRRNKMIMHFTHLNGLDWVIFLLRTMFKLLFSWVKLDFVYYVAFKNFFLLIPDVIRFRKMLTNKAKELNRKLLPLRVVVSEIQKEIRVIADVELF